MEIKVRKLMKWMWAVLAASIIFRTVVRMGFNTSHEIGTKQILQLVVMIIVVGLGVLAYYKQRNPPAPQADDERSLYVRLMAAFAAFGATLCFLMIYDAVHYLKTGVSNPLGSYTVIVLCCSFVLCHVAFQKAEK
ncbi:MAG: hypothetical protein A2X34_07030 [Elusimicrobia bacterium GWC2_51_8]|nr:MAG: hypothetical protein A2X33_06320 [Elusimicrobia bacterium GWA2_51_34]OGR61081.1 MAG: hypothetical protein A2X34_07030 [Elusimicrobia bacterium GWC2_51_8]OGR87894.1 MAG: hypothetical protein A2021_05965 [Elusimicrobia bacterium GWF2_52_66]HAF95711.1 hypothetical protein [Elusimicrobiota bacterium]HCE97034.1 hypothetical protein [Elusimicrobiota bacterium]